MPIVADRQSGEITFILCGYADARRVYLTGDFNRWDPRKQRMAKYRDGSFRARLPLGPGAYQYKFVADGVWVNDPEAPEQVANPFGTVNGVVRID
jgi:1,4-alpha-glucan branching enzyme